jgi:hypothetical protein
MLVDVYIDESGQTDNRYLVLGGITIPTDAVQAANEAIWARRQPELPEGEMKWGKVSKAKLPAYQRVLDGFFDDPQISKAQYHSIVVDTPKLNHDVFNSGSADVGFNKELYQLARKCARLYPTANFHIYPDFRPTKQHPDELRVLLNLGHRKLVDSRENPFKRCQFRNSKETPLLWLADLFSGALGYLLNGRDKAKDASTHKVELARYILSRAKVRNPFIDTPRASRFTIWHRQYRDAPKTSNRVRRVP